jgi:hypothetical protein
MKRKRIYKLLIGCLFAVPCLSAQEQTLNCNENLQKPLAHLQGTVPWKKIV